MLVDEDGVCLQDVRLVRSLLQRHSRYTASPTAKALLSNWTTAQGHFVKIFPHEYRRALEEAEKTKVCVVPGCEKLLPPHRYPPLLGPTLAR